MVGCVLGTDGAAAPRRTKDRDAISAGLCGTFNIGVCRNPSLASLDLAAWNMSAVALWAPTSEPSLSGCPMTPGRA